MLTIKAKQIPKTQSAFTIDDLAARICYYYPQYTYADVLHLQMPVIKRLLRTIDREKSMHYFNMVKIVAAPHSRKGENVKKLLEYFKSKMEGK